MSQVEDAKPAPAPDDPLPKTTFDPRASVVLEVLKLAAPTVLTMLSYTAMQFADAIMVSRIEPYSPAGVAATGNGGVWAFVPASFFAGLVGVVNTYVAQNLGAGTPRNGPAYAWNALWLGLLWWLGAMLPLALAMPFIFAQMNHAPDLVRVETAYAQILLCGGIITLSSRALSQFFYGIHRPAVTLIGAVVGNLVNLFFNWVLIYGNLGSPALGVTGSAIATVIGTAVELSIPAAVFLSTRYDREFGTRSAWRFSVRHIYDILRIGWPAAVMFGSELMCWAVFMAGLAGAFGTVHNTASVIALRYMHASFMPAVGVSFAMTAIVGKCIGAGRPDLVPRRVAIGVGMAMLYMGACAICFVLFREDMISLFIDRTASEQDRADLLRVGSWILIVAAVFQVFDGLGITLIGALRGAGDTVWPGVATIILSWTLIVGLGWVMVHAFPGLTSAGPWMAAGAYLIAIGLALAWRFRTGAWKRLHVLNGGK